LLRISRSFMNVSKIALWRMAIILMANKVNFFVSYVLFVLWYNSPNFLDTPHNLNIGLSLSFDRTQFRRPVQSFGGKTRGEETSW
jgi:hypothetical protein